jgi:hypothetical protein
MPHRSGASAPRPSKKPPHRLGAERDSSAHEVVRAHYRARRSAERRIGARSIEAAAASLARRFGGRARAARVARRWERTGADPRFLLVARCLEHAAVA